MKKTSVAKIILTVSTIMFTSSASSATWHGMMVISDESAYFFDSETVQKTPSSVSIWVKTVRLSSPDKDGAWATAWRQRFNCAARTVQTITYSDYDEKGNFISSNNREGPASLTAPDSTGEAMLKIFCEPNFPNDKSEQNYWKIIDNDVFKARDIIVRSSIDNAPK